MDTGKSGHHHTPCCQSSAELCYVPSQWAKGRIHVLFWIQTTQWDKSPARDPGRMTDAPPTPDRTPLKCLDTALYFQHGAKQIRWNKNSTTFAFHLCLLEAFAISPTTETDFPLENDTGLDLACIYHTYSLFPLPPGWSCNTWPCQVAWVMTLFFFFHAFLLLGRQYMKEKRAFEYEKSAFGSWIISSLNLWIFSNSVTSDNLLSIFHPQYFYY